MVTEDIQHWICHDGFIFSLSVSVFKKTLQYYGSRAEPWTAYNRYTYLVKNKHRDWIKCSGH